MTEIPAKPTKIIVGYKDNISTAGERLTTTATPVKKVVTIKVRSLGGGSYIAIGNEEEQPFRLGTVGDTLDIDWIDDLSKVVAITDAGTTGYLEWIGG